MMLFERPEVLLLSAAIPVALIYVFAHIRNIARIAASDPHGKTKLFKLRVRSALWALAWLCIVIALAGPTWGIEPVPVERSGSAICFVFDISYSMTAEDVFIKKEKLSRLDASKRIALSLSERINGASAAVVLAKGGGILALPLTEDYNALENLISVLSPAMLSAPGSNIASGIERALDAFPPQSARNSFIVVFTDGDETEGNIARSVLRCSSFGVHVFLVGTGTDTETEILAGDGKTPVKTALRKARLEKAAESDTVHYISASDEKAASLIADAVASFSSPLSGTKDSATGYEMQKAKHHAWFLLAGVFLFIAGFICVQLGPVKKAPLVLMCLLLTLSGCSSWKKEQGTVLLGSYYWSRHDYQKAAAAFLAAAERAEQVHSEELSNYALYALGASYLMQDENAAALAKFDQIAPDAPDPLLYALRYNKGIIAYRAGDFAAAADCFKSALAVDGTSLDAKVNLELSLQQKHLKPKNAVRELVPAQTHAAPPGAEDAVFSLIRENDKKRWKSQYAEPAQNETIDY